jgi:thiol-disulfide isomerase/thioredoxin
MRRRAAVLVMVLLAASVDAAVGLGDRPPDFTLATRAGAPFAVAAARGQVVLLDFWASWCSPCARALPRLDALARHHAADGLVVVAIGIDEDPATADRFLAERIPYPAMTIVRDPGGKLLARFGARGMPALYLLDREGVVRVVEAGYDPARLEHVEAEVEHLLAAPPDR